MALNKRVKVAKHVKNTDTSGTTELKEYGSVHFIANLGTTQTVIPQFPIQLITNKFYPTVGTIS